MNAQRLTIGLLGTLGVILASSAAAQGTPNCGRRTDCTEVTAFVATITDFRTSQAGRTKLVTTTVRFRNKTNRPLTLGYVQNSGVVTDDQGNRYGVNAAQSVRGIGWITGSTFDPKFTLQPGEASDARIDFSLAITGNTIYGTRYDVELAVREIDPLPGNQFRLGREHALQFRGFGSGGVAAAEEPVSSTGGGGSTEKPSATAITEVELPAEADPCEGRGRCYGAGPFVAEVTQLAASGTARERHHFLRITVKFRNLTNQPLILAYKSGTSGVMDNLGNRYFWGRAGTHDGSVTGMGYLTGRAADPQFVLAPGQSRTAIFSLFRPEAGRLEHGTSFTHDFTVAQLELLPSKQVRALRDFVVSFPDLSPGSTASPQAATNEAAAKLVDALRKKLEKKP